MSSRWLSRLAVATAAAGAFMIGAASVAWADTLININPQQVPVTAKDFDGDTCDGPFEDLDENTDGWHFSLPAGAGDDFTSLTLTFSTPGGTVTAVITSTNPDSPSSGSGWEGYFATAGQSGDFKHAYVFTDAGWTLTAGSAMVSGTSSGPNPQFVLSHTCAGTPTTPTPSPSPSPTPSDGESTPPGDGESTPGGGDGGGGLPVTGAAVGGVIVLGLGLVAGGIALMAVRRRRDVFEA